MGKVKWVILLVLVVLLTIVVFGCGQKTLHYETIHAAAAKGDIDDVKMHLRRGSAVNAEDERGLTPLHWAAVIGHTEIAKLLLDRGADVNARDKRGMTPLHWANNADMASLLLDRGADINSTDDDCYTPLHYAARVGSTETAELLLDRSADIKVKSNYGTTPLYEAAEKGSIEIVRLLIKSGADVNEQVDGWTVLHGAASSGQTEVVKGWVRRYTADFGNRGGPHRNRQLTTTAWSQVVTWRAVNVRG